MPTPTFTQPIFQELYQKDFFIDEAVLEEILALEPAVSVPELLKITDDTLANFDIYSPAAAEWSSDFHFLHALYLLHDLDAPEVLDIGLQLLRKPHDYQEYWFGDNLYEDMPVLLARAGRNRLAECLAFVDNPGHTLHSRNLMDKALMDIARRYPEKRPEIIGFFRQYLQRIIGHADEVETFYPEDKDASYGYDIYTYLGFLLGDLQEIDAQELTEEIRDCHQLDLVDKSIGGGEEDIEFEQMPVLPMLDIFTRYEQFKTWPMGEDSPFNPDAAAIQARKARQMQETRARLAAAYPQPKIADPKIGRNDPCPCGSGKKYKKCCLV